LNNTHLALMHFSWAMDLDPKGANSQIKDALDPAMNRAAQEEANIGDGNNASSVGNNDMQDGEEPNDVVQVTQGKQPSWK